METPALVYETDPVCGGSEICSTQTGITSINSPQDSAEEDVIGGTVSLGSSDLELMHDGADSEQVVAVVFPYVNVPTGASVDAAQVVFMVRARPGRSNALRVFRCKIGSVWGFCTGAQGA